MPIDPARIGFSPVGETHYPLLLAWLNEPHVREWWGDPEEELGFIRDMVEGRDTTRPFLIQLDGEPVGYIQYWFLGHHQNEDWTKENPWLLELPQEAVGVDLSIGHADKLSAGIGSAALSAFAADLHGLGHKTIIIDPDPANARAVRAYAKAGFRPVPELEDRTGNDVLIMQFDPKANQIS
ncbi:aminoglycoside 6'-N-acetyltransferase [Rhizobium azooxidifex]|uniref:Aminoglycoside 6'-N-acetyltransferase n=1 Tax=Mycoplana azooxidifex TaxID=1636188 RepID=A0A7W6GKS3_9HYPH|nr:GNAT family N-acetyltransferase [Mycoplana azooxidifex]MBB3977194.1 aminoglycoside 6'-N-acetyltransferase [Mycoplana azooxidifex]